MPRRISKTGIYHVMVRGVNKNPIFFSEIDRKVFVEKIKYFSLDQKIDIYAFCLMDNHIHLLIGDEYENISLFMQKLLSSYVRYINSKCGRVGHLFQERFKSEVVETDLYYKTVLRYILQNPLKAGISTMEKYKWSSYSAFFSKKSFIKIDYSINLFNSKKDLLKFLKEKNEDFCMEYEMTSAEKEIYSFMLAKKILNGTNINDFKNLKKDDQIFYLKRMKYAGLSIRKISKICDISKDFVFRA